MNSELFFKKTVYLWLETKASFVNIHTCKNAIMDMCVYGI